MFQLLFTIVSFGALLLLLMRATIVGILLTAVLFACGVGLIIYRKKHKIVLPNNKRHFLIMIAAVLISSYFGLVFYNRWMPSSKIQAIVVALQLPRETILSISSFVLAALSVFFVYIGLIKIIKLLSNITAKNEFVSSLVYCSITSVVMVMVSQIMINTTAVSMGYEKFMWAVWIVEVVILLLYCVFGKILPSIFVGAGIFMVISTVNVYIYRFRARLFEPVDIFSIGTAMNVADNYNLLPISANMCVGWGSFFLLLILCHCLNQKAKSGFYAKKRFAVLVFCVISSVTIFFYTSNLKTYHWQDEGVWINGYILEFVSKFKEITVQEPDEYSIEHIENITDQYIANDKNSAEEVKALPHIIVIMDEAFSDLSVVGDILTNKEVMPFISSLKENTISGSVLTSVYGGNTANSEYEFLTGNSMAWLAPNVVPYQQYVRSSTYSMVSYLKLSYNYKCVAMHPSDSGGWNRPSAYGHFGFDACSFIEEFPGKKYVRKYISDQEMFEFLIETYEKQKDNPLFIFGITMQNHGGYTYTGENYTQHISMNQYGKEYPEVEQYLSLIYETDKAVEQLITYFQNEEEDVVIVFFGDHQPHLRESFYETISETSADTLNEQQKRYEVPFFIWANYDIEEEHIERTSLNYLSTYVYNAAGIALPPYNQFLQEMEDVIPSINANGFYSKVSGCYLPFEEANEEELQWLRSYESLQYNSLFDKKHRSEILFPTLE